MIIKDNIIDLEIISIAHGGEGIAKYDGMTIFIPDTVPGDKIKAKVVLVKKNYAKAIIQEIVQPSQNRTAPFCGIAKVCGGCQMQHIEYEEQLNIKRKIIENCVKKIANIDVPVYSPIENQNLTNYRCKVQYPVQQTKVSKRYLVGYYKKGSHEIVNIKHCPVQPALIDKITEFLRETSKNIGITAYNEKSHQGLIRHFVFRYSHTNNNLLLIIVINSQQTPDIINEFCIKIKKEFSEIIGILVNHNTSKSNVIMSYDTELVLGDDFIEEVLNDKKFKISAPSFFQVNPLTATKMFETVTKIIYERTHKPTVLDVYSGVGAFTIFLNDIASKIVSIEENPHAVRDAKDNILLNKSDEQAEIKVLEGNADNVLAELVENNNKFNVVIIDPPRKGCSQNAIESIIKLVDDLIIYVSCDPATLARDLKIFNENGFIPEFIQPVDMFSHTFHIESIVVLKRQ